ncbi:glycoside hydrolase family protein [Megalodesulfovibrio gigas]|uniref:Uncharacterized protein n=1 Tax=Megalodesulfovibrio gigas (strain ATCC 19364 / DSM 1382 / NCIMB 9332 / VKM B-1759) TaxID=1121448 RepID=T2GFT2_MEGG1|nr:hypothetical protein [Megalodesulfovibrio gigas]AGW15016.1 hypothetical protein DGI_3322 [Megalodesulfovibrio gigas DSM 1382 = ATCC 19364]
MSCHVATVWRRMRRIIGPAEYLPWNKSRVGLPVCLPCDEHCWRIWFSACNEQGQSDALCVDVDPSDAMNILAFRQCPGLERGGDGAFDSAGLMPGCVLAVDGCILLWYSGMRLRQDVPYELAIGLAISEDGGVSFRKVSEAPVLTAGPDDAGLAHSPMVVHHPDGFEMWYAGGTEWTSFEGRVNPQYSLRCAHSPDGIHWTPAGPVFALAEQGIGAAGRPWFVASERPRLFFDVRGANRFREPTSGEAYRLHHAPLHGKTIRPAEIEPVVFTPVPTADDWDGWMQAYCCIVPFRDSHIMFYTGNGFGRAGFGYAVAEPVSGAEQIPDRGRS